MNKVNNKIFVLAIVTFVVVLTLLALMLTGAQTMKAPSEESMIESAGQEDAAVREAESTTPNRQKTFCINEGSPQELCGNAINIGILENTGDIIFDTWISEESIQAIIDNPSCETMAQTEIIGFDIKFKDTENCFTIIEEDNVFIGGMSIGAYYEDYLQIFSGVLWIHKGQPYQLEMPKNETIDHDQRKIRENILRELDDQFGTPGLTEFTVGFEEINEALESYMQSSPTIEQALTEMKRYITNRLWSYSNSLPKAFALNGNVYYVNEEGLATLIAEKERPETCPNADSPSFCNVEYFDATLSPNRNWILLEAGCHEDRCHRVYNLATGEIRMLSKSPSLVSWGSDNKISASGVIGSSIQSPFPLHQSMSADRPWELRPIINAEWEIKTEEVGGNQVNEIWVILSNSPGANEPYLLGTEQGSCTNIQINEPDVLIALSCYYALSGTQYVITRLEDGTITAEKRVENTGEIIPLEL